VEPQAQGLCSGALSLLPMHSQSAVLLGTRVPPNERFSCMGNPAGDLNWLHGHWGNRAGTNHYGFNSHANLHFSVANVDNWLTMCADIPCLN